MDDFHIITSMEPLMICRHKCHYAILDIYIPLLTIRGVVMLNA